jgi:FHA domain
MTQPSATRPTYLVVESPGSDHGRRIDLVGNRLTVGRLQTCDVRFDDLQVSRTHATLWRQGDADYVEDLGSSGGTYVNNVVITGPHELRAGDTVAFAGLRLRYRADGSDNPGGRTFPRREPQEVRYDIGEQRAGAINNVGRDQYNYSQHVIQQRESFFREIAATKTKARWLVWIGVGLFVIGLGIASVGGFNYLQWFAGVWGSSTAPELDLTGLLTAAVGGLINTVGILLIVIGIVLHIIATSRRKRVDRVLPPPPPQYRGQ